MLPKDSDGWFSLIDKYYKEVLPQTKTRTETEFNAEVNWLKTDIATGVCNNSMSFTTPITDSLCQQYQDYCAIVGGRRLTEETLPSTPSDYSNPRYDEFKRISECVSDFPELHKKSLAQIAKQWVRVSEAHLAIEYYKNYRQFYLK